MKKKSLTVIRNAKIVGKNSKSYNAKHPVSLVSLRPIHDACKATNKDAFKLRAKIRVPLLTENLSRAIGTTPFKDMSLDDLEIVDAD